MILYIVRHAQSANNRIAAGMEYEVYMRDRSPDPPLTELGQRQALAVAQYLAEVAATDPFDRSEGDRQITHLYCSAMLRTLQTTQPVGQALALAPEIWLDLHEHGGLFHGNPRNGDNLRSYPGITRPQVESAFPGFVLPDGLTEDGWWRGVYEDMPGCYARAIRVARTLRRRAEENRASGVAERMVLLSHGTFIDCLLKAFFNQAPQRQLFYFHYNTAITRVDFRPDDTLVLRYLNRTQHLPSDLLSE